MLPPRFTALAALISALACPVGLAQEGLFADFSTSLGGFTCQLDFTNSPQAAANFVGLATGEHAWMESASGRIRSGPFYDGLTFHRVISGFMIQSGSPSGLRTGGPGYVFPDTFTSLLRHDGAGVLSMANSGPNSNGSQFFITVAPTPWLDDRHTIFGRVVQGQEVVDAISEAPTDLDEKPKIDVALLSVSVRRVGAAAEAFDGEAHDLPIVSAVHLDVGRLAGGIALAFTNALYADNRLGLSANLTNWIASPLGTSLEPPLPNRVTLPTNGEQQFLTLTRVQYPGSTLAPPSLAGYTLTLNLDSLGLLVIQLGENGQGIYLHTDTQGELFYGWRQDVYRGDLTLVLSTLGGVALRLHFTDEQSGTATGSREQPPSALAGSFTLARAS